MTRAHNGGVVWRPPTRSRGYLDTLVELFQTGQLDRALAEHPGRVGGHVEDRGRSIAVGGSAVEVDLDRLAEHLLRVVDGRRRRLAGAVGATHRERPGPAQQLQYVVVVGHPDGHGGTGVAEVPGERRLLLADQRERTGPEGVDEFAGEVRHLGGQRVQGGLGGDQNRRRHAAAAALGPEQPAYGGRVEGVSGDAVDGVGGQDDELARAQRYD